MLTKPSFPPPALAVLVMAIFLGVLLSREASTTEGLPVFLPLQRELVQIELVGEGLVSGAYQFNDGMTIFDVIKLTEASPGEIVASDPVWLRQLQTGESFKIVKKDRGIEVLHQGWMKASHRVAMVIPLHPDRMSKTDWTVLSGVGEALAERIETDRQNNGRYGHLDALIRVKGVGKKRIDSWREFF